VLSERAIKRLAEVITGDAGLSPYRSGPKLVAFFNQFGLNNIYPSGGGFPARWAFAEDCMRALNDEKNVQKIVRAVFDPREFLGTEISDKTTGLQKRADIVDAVNYVNEMWDFDGLELVKDGRFYRVTKKDTPGVEFSVNLELDHLSREFILEQIDKCRSKILLKDYDGAITNSRSLVEAVLTAIEGKCDPTPPSYDGDLQKLYKRVQGHLKLSPENPQISENLKQLLRGFVNIIHGLAGLSNKMGDRHVREYKPAQHHAVLIVNSAMTLTNFVFDTYSYQRERSG
jgi:hypothetical protein